MFKFVYLDGYALKGVKKINLLPPTGGSGANKLILLAVLVR